MVVKATILSLTIALTPIRDVLKECETNNNPTEVGDGGRAKGVLQIHKGAISDVNRRFGTSYTHDEMFVEECAEEVFELYMIIGQEYFCKRYGRDMTEEDVVRGWNGGIYNGWRNKRTLKYWKRYLRFKGKDGNNSK